MLKRIIGLALASLTSLLFFAPPVSAYEAGDIVFQITPADQDIELEAGESCLSSIRVKNVGRLPITVNVSVRPYQVLDEDYNADFVTENDYTKLSNWIILESPSYSLEPGDEEEIVFLITVPDDVPGGGQYAAILVETRDSIDDDATVKVIGQIASLIHAHVAGEEHVGGVIMAQSLPRFLLGSPFTSKVTVKNDGNVDFRLRHSLTIYDYFTHREVFTPESLDANGNLIGTVKPAILPATRRTSTLTWSGAPQLGVFPAVQTVSFLDEEYTYEQVVILCPIWLAGAAALLVALMVLWLIVRLYHRKRSRPQVL